MCLNNMGKGGTLGRQCGVREGAQAMQLDSCGFQYPDLPFVSYLNLVIHLSKFQFFHGKKGIIYIKHLE